MRGQRYHFLRLDPHRNLAHVEAAGFAYDSTLGFNDAPGFRAGIAHPFRPWNLERDAPRDIVEVPLAAMDVTLSEERYLSLSARQAGERLLTLLDWAAEHGGGFAVLWHSEQYDSAIKPRLGPAVPAVHGGRPRARRHLRAGGRACRGGAASGCRERARCGSTASGAGRIGSAGALPGARCRGARRRSLSAGLLPAHGPALALRLAAAAACVLLVPGGIFVRALGRPAAFGVALAASFVWSLAALAGALALTFALDGTIETTLWLLAGFAAAALVPALMRAPVASEPTERRACCRRRRRRRSLRGRGLVDGEHDLRRRPVPPRAGSGSSRRST